MVLSETEIKDFSPNSVQKFSAAALSSSLDSGAKTKVITIILRFTRVGLACGLQKKKLVEIRATVRDRVREGKE